MDLYCLYKIMGLTNWRDVFIAEETTTMTVF